MYTALNTATIGSRSVQDMDSFARGWKDLHALWEQEPGVGSGMMKTILALLPRSSLLLLHPSYSWKPQG